ncbi:response regulator [Pelagibaculum spongiae]|uniref:Two-component system response regulator n=1 Tax=Pelagibaculum spongiae TaxID=2080658 RepID=A0A2V1H5Y4_9GAMM|nr:response regulator [Pelagibaculum spongiae]PVZ72165.1 two-component system response regulator [Pelagibaculum spongiae]
MAKIMVIDDSATEIRVLQNLLEKKGHQVSVALSAEEGLNMLPGASPDLVLMDVVMPGMNGFQATRKLSKNPDTSHIPVVIVTTKNQETDRIWGLRQGAKGFLTKPVAENELFETIESLVG